MGKLTAAIAAALVTVALHRLLIGLGLRHVAVPAVIATASVRASGAWPASRSGSMDRRPLLDFGHALLQLARLSRAACSLAGLTTAMLVAVRPIDLIFALVRGRLGRLDRSATAWLVPAGAAWCLVSSLVGYNQYYFGLSPAARDSWSTSTVRSTGRRSLVGQPQGGHGRHARKPEPRPLRLLALGRHRDRLGPVRLARAPRGSLAAGSCRRLVTYLFVLSKYAVWWAGGSFGPRYWTDALPLSVSCWRTDSTGRGTIRADWWLFSR